MHKLLVAGTLAFALILDGGAAARAEGPGVRQDVAPLYGGRQAAPAPPAVTPRYRPSRPVINCDAYGRCWQGSPGYGDYGWRGGTRPPGWADDLPRRARDPFRFQRPRSGVVCDQGTSVCYKRGRIDRSETREMFGGRAADRADDLRDERGTGRVFVPERDVSCDPGRQVCFDEGVPDRSLTRRYFGRNAAGSLD
jgi:hypothetical protein